MQIAPKQIKTNSEPQDAFVFSDVFETLYGGKAGGGKSYALIVAALLEAEKPDYSAILFRKTYPQLSGKGGLIELSREIYPYAGAEYDQQDKTWLFPSGAHVKFSHMQNQLDHYNHQGKEYHFVGFDELTHFEEEQYLYLFSRIRKRATSNVKTRMAAASNPGKRWVFLRWRPWLDPNHPNPAGPGEVRYYKRSGESEVECKADDPDGWSRTFIPSSYLDNPDLDSQYERNLDLLPFIERQRLKYGDWQIEEGRGTILNKKWFQIVDSIPSGHRAWRYWDFAATEKKITGTKKSSYEPDYTATCYLAEKDGQFYILIHRRQATWDTVKKWVSLHLQKEKWAVHGGEEEPGASGKVLSHELSKLATQAGCGWHAIRPNGDKVTRALRWSALAEQGRIHIVRGGEDVDMILSEFHSFPEGGHDDMVDAVSGCFSLFGAAAGGKIVGRY